MLAAFWALLEQVSITSALKLDFSCLAQSGLECTVGVRAALGLATGVEGVVGRAPGLVAATGEADMSIAPSSRLLSRAPSTAFSTTPSLGSISTLLSLKNIQLCTQITFFENPGILDELPRVTLN